LWLELNFNSISYIDIFLKMISLFIGAEILEAVTIRFLESLWFIFYKFFGV